MKVVASEVVVVAIVQQSEALFAYSILECYQHACECAASLSIYLCLVDAADLFTATALLTFTTSSSNRVSNSGRVQRVNECRFSTTCW